MPARLREQRGLVSPQYLSGSFEHSLDDKNRVIIPSAYRPALGNKFYLTKSLTASEKHLSLYPEVEYEKLVTHIESRIPKRDVKGQWLLRDFYSYSTELEMDGQGRITVPTLQREYADIRKRVVFVGRQGWAELWDADTWEAGLRTAEGDLADYVGE
jgi:MraZ protein